MFSELSRPEHREWRRSFICSTQTILCSPFQLQLREKVSKFSNWRLLYLNRFSSGKKPYPFTQCKVNRHPQHCDSWAQYKAREDLRAPDLQMQGGVMQIAVNCVFWKQFKFKQVTQVPDSSTYCKGRQVTSDPGSWTQSKVRRVTLDSDSCRQCKARELSQLQGRHMFIYKGYGRKSRVLFCGTFSVFLGGIADLMIKNRTRNLQNPYSECVVRVESWPEATKFIPFTEL